MSHILRRMGVAALQFRQAGERRVVGPILGRRQLKGIREQWLAEGKGWPYEDIYPGACDAPRCFSGRRRRERAAAPAGPTSLPRAAAARAVPCSSCTPLLTLAAAPRRARNPRRRSPRASRIAGPPKAPDAPPYGTAICKGAIKKEAAREARAKHIAECMARMPTLVADFRSSRRVKPEDVTPQDRMLLTAKQIRFKYVFKKLMNR